MKLSFGHSIPIISKITGLYNNLRRGVNKHLFFLSTINIPLIKIRTLRYEVFDGVIITNNDTIRIFLLKALMDDKYSSTFKKFKPSLNKNNDIVCHAAGRSFNDLFIIVNNYFPHTTEEELANILITMCIHDNFFVLFCPDILKHVFAYYETKKGVQKGDSKISYQSYADLINNDAHTTGYYKIKEIIKLSGYTNKQLVNT